MENIQTFKVEIIENKYTEEQIKKAIIKGLGDLHESEFSVKKTYDSEGFGR